MLSLRAKNLLLGLGEMDADSDALKMLLHCDLYLSGGTYQDWV